MAEVTPNIAGSSGKTQSSVAKFADGTFTGRSQAVQTFIANAAIVEGEVVMIVPPTATTDVRVARTPAGLAGTIGRKVVGVALNSAAAGETVRVATDYGWVRAQGTADTQGLQASATAGVTVGATAAATLDVQFADILVGTTASVFASVTSPATNAETNGCFVRFYGSV